MYTCWFAHEWGSLQNAKEEKFDKNVLSCLFIPPSPLIIRHPWQTSQCCPQPYGSRLPLASIGILQSYCIKKSRYCIKKSFIHLISPELSPPTAAWSFVTPVPWSSADFPVVGFMQITSHKFINSPCLHECKLPHFTKYCISSSLQVPSHCW